MPSVVMEESWIRAGNFMLWVRKRKYMPEG